MEKGLQERLVGFISSVEEELASLGNDPATIMTYISSSLCGVLGRYAVRAVSLGFGGVLSPERVQESAHRISGRLRETFQESMDAEGRRLLEQMGSGEGEKVGQT